MKDGENVLVPDDDLQVDLEEARRLWIQLEVLKISLKTKCDDLGTRLGLTGANVKKLLELQTHFNKNPQHEMTLTLRTMIERSDTLRAVIERSAAV